jgi:hypothetical protein
MNFLQQMNKYQISLLKFLKKVYQIGFRIEKDKVPERVEDADLASSIIYENLNNDKPCMIGRFGSNELLCLVTYLGVKENNKNIFSYISGESQAWWWNEQNLVNMNTAAGFFPPLINEFERFSELLFEDISQINVLASWLPAEKKFESKMKNCDKIHFELLNPYFSKIPWTKVLEGKKVLVVHPFTKTIQSQFKKREFLFKDNLLPNFDLKIIQAVQSLAGSQTQFSDWFEALEYMKNEIDKVDYDICLIGCGAYGFHLAAHVKRKGKKAVHMGGSLQLLFGIKGKRWENPYYNSTYNYAQLINEHWVYPSEEERPKNANLVEGGCYW